jgi:hypothetical protein
MVGAVTPATCKPCAAGYFCPAGCPSGPFGIPCGAGNYCPAGAGATAGCLSLLGANDSIAATTTTHWSANDSVGAKMSTLFAHQVDGDNINMNEAQVEINAEADAAALRDAAGERESEADADTLAETAATRDADARADRDAAPPLAVGPARVSVSTNGLDWAAAGEPFRYLPAPRLLGAWPASGPEGGGTVVAVSHADPIKAAVALATGVHLDLFQRIVIL